MLARIGRRSGFTLIELMVSAALTMIIMIIITQAFSIALETFRQLKATAVLQEQMRGAALVLRRDLAAEHFGPGRLGTFNRDGAHGPYLRDQRLDRWEWQPPEEGFFAIYSAGPGAFTYAFLGTTQPPPAPPLAEGIDPRAVPSYRAIDHALHFTVRLDGSSRSQLFSTRYNHVPPTGTPTVTLSTDLSPLNFQTAGQFVSQWAEIAYFLTPNNQPAVEQTNTTPQLRLFTLRRRQRLLIPLSLQDQWNASNGRALTTPARGGISAANADPNVGNPEISHVISGGQVFYNTSADVVFPSRRLNSGLLGHLGTPTALAGNAAGDDLLLSNVISFEVKPTWEDSEQMHERIRQRTPPWPATSTFSPSPDIPALGGTPPNFDWPFSYLPPQTMNTTRPFVFDTWGKRQDPVTTQNLSGWNPLNDPTTGQNANYVPLRVNIKALQIRIRVWDPKTEQTRQISFTQDV
jgi:type II secretory pathway pseudopilin PulG